MEKAFLLRRESWCSMLSRRAHFVGGHANGQWDTVTETSPGVLPHLLVVTGSIYDLVEFKGRQPEYHLRTATLDGSVETSSLRTPEGRSDAPGSAVPVANGPAWPIGWPRVYAADPGSVSTVTQRVRFVGGGAAGLVDRVAEIKPGRLPQRVECLGSTYHLAEVDGWPEYHVNGTESARTN